MVVAVIGVAILRVLLMPLGMTRPEVPANVEELKRLPEGAVLDLASDAPQALFYQTVHEKPIVFGDPRGCRVRCSTPSSCWCGPFSTVGGSRSPTTTK